MKISKYFEYIFMFLTALFLAIILILIVSVILDDPLDPEIDQPSDYFRYAELLPYLETDQYTVVSYEGQIYESFMVLKINEESDFYKFINDLENDEIIEEQEVIDGRAPILNLIEETTINGTAKIDLLPFDLRCNCFRYFTINADQSVDNMPIDRAYLILVYKNLIIINYILQ